MPVVPTGALPLYILIVVSSPAAPETPARPASAVVRVTTRDCGELSASEIERLLSIELGALAKAHRAEGCAPVAVNVDCEAPSSTIHVEVGGPPPGHATESRFPQPAPDEPDRNRVVALAIFEQFGSTWPALLSQPAPSPAPPAPSAQSPRFAASVEVAARARDLPSALFVERAAVRGGWWQSGPWMIEAEAAIESGGVQRPKGTVDFIDALLGGGALVRIANVGRISLDADALLSLGYVRFSGHPAGPDVQGSTSGALSGELAGSVIPTFMVGRALLGLRLAVGWMARTATALISSDEPISPGGFWVGIGLECGIAFGHR